MRLRLSLLLALAATRPAPAQMPAGPDGWHLSGGVDAVRFGHVAVGEAAPGISAEVRPSARPAVHLALGRSTGPWDVCVEVGWADGNIEAGNDVIVIRDLTTDVTRYRLSLGLTRRLAPLGTGGLGVQLAPTVDLWSVPGENRARIGAEARLVLLVPLGSVELEHRLGFGLSGSPIETQDLGQAVEERGLRSLSIGLGLRAPL